MNTVVSVLWYCTDVLGWVALTQDWGESELYRERETQRENVFKLVITSWSSDKEMFYW